MAHTLFYPTAGYILDVSQGAEPGPLSKEERESLRSLARKVSEIANNPKQEEKRNLWYRHNRLEKVRPMVLVFPEDSWIEIIGEDELKVQDPYWRQWEWYLKHLIYRDQNLPDDFVVEPDLYVNTIIKTGGWGVEGNCIKPEEEKGACRWEPPLKEPDDIRKLTHPTIEVDREATRKRLSAVTEVFGDILSVHPYTQPISANLIGEAAVLRGIEQVMWDMYDRPEWLHQLMNFITEGILKMADYLEKNNLLTLNNRNHYNDSGGIGYTSELPAPDFDGKHVRPGDLWGFGVAQEFSEVGPAQHEEFLLNYQLRILERYGLNAYGCCEPYTHKFEMLKKRVPRLRRGSVSSWCDVEAAAKELEDKYIFSWKPNPAIIVGKFDPDRIRAYIQKTLQVARGCVLEIILKDTFTIDHDPERLQTWLKLCREEIEKTGKREYG